MGKFWSIVFGVTMAACLGLFLVSPALGWWLPEGVSTHAGDIDFLFYIILWITTVFFIITEAVLVIFMFQYASPRPKSPHITGKTLSLMMVRPFYRLLNTPQKVELAWTILPAAILLWIAFAQISTWADVKYKSRMPEFSDKNAPLQVDVSARQFEWRMRYASSKRYQEWIKDRSDKDDFNQFAKNPHADDVHVVNELHVWKGQPVVVWLSTRDVLHSFNLPHMRVKQDAVPGKTIPVWFTPTKSNTRRILDTDRWEDGINTNDPNNPKRGDAKFIWDLPCAELCGWGHYRMIGRLYVHETMDDWLAWLTTTEKQYQSP